MIPDDVVNQVREQADIVAIVGELVKLKRVGNSFRGPCPFHEGKDPNFSVSPRGGYMCFVCHEKGDVFSFVQKRLGLDFVDAVKYVGEKSGVDVKEVSRERAAGPDPRERFWEINAAAADFFTKTLWEAEIGAPARDYLVQRKMDRKTADRFGLGFAPKDAGLLRAHLQTLGYDDAVQTQAGLIVVRNVGDEPRPRFRNRLMFPIYDPQSRVIAFGGRVLDAREPKYLNSAESPTFQKGSTLYGLNWAKHAIRKEERALLVEGYFDCVRLQAAGIESAVAPLGTALTDSQAELIRKYTNTVFLLYDSDKAGLRATFRNGDVLLRQGFKVHVVTLPEGEDPDSFVLRHGRDGLEAQLSNAIDVFERKLQILQRGGWFSDLRRKRVALDRLLPTIRSATDPITRGLYLGRAAEVAGLTTDVLERELKQGKPPKARARAAAAPTAPESAERRKRQVDKRRPQSFDSAERELVRLMLHRRQDVEAVAELVEVESFREPALAEIFRHLTTSPTEPLDSMASVLDDEAVGILDDLANDRGGLDDPQKIMRDCVSAMRKRGLSAMLDSLNRQLPLAQGTEKDELIREMRRLQTEMQKLGGPSRWKSFGRTRQ